MDKNLILGLVAFAALVSFFAAQLKASSLLKLYGATTTKVLKPQRWLWRLTGNAERFLLVAFVGAVLILVAGGALSLNLKDPDSSKLWGLLVFIPVLGYSLFDIFRKRR